ncbi:MAG: glutamine synthetase beta-grasp domain-containing protein [Planctomycetota bacterium]|jgi:glutamine synthetase
MSHAPATPTNNPDWISENLSCTFSRKPQNNRHRIHSVLSRVGARKKPLLQEDPNGTQSGARTGRKGCDKVYHSALHDGVWFDGSSIEGFARIQESDLFLKPDTATYAVVPWLTEEGKTARLICDIYRADGSPFEGDPRFILKQAVAEAASEGLEFNAATLTCPPMRATKS